MRTGLYILGLVLSSQFALAAPLPLDFGSHGDSVTYVAKKKRHGKKKKKKSKRKKIANPKEYATSVALEGDKLAQTGDSAAAEAKYREALEYDASNVLALRGLGDIEFGNGNFDAAADNFRKSIAVDPTYVQGYYRLGYALRRGSKYDEAASAYDEYIKRNPSDPDGYYGYAESLRLGGKKLEAAKFFDKYAEVEKRPSEREWVDKAKVTAQKLRQEAVADKAAAERAAAEKIAAERAAQQEAAAEAAAAAAKAAAAKAAVEKAAAEKAAAEKAAAEKVAAEKAAADRAAAARAAADKAAADRAAADRAAADKAAADKAAADKAAAKTASAGVSDVARQLSQRQIKQGDQAMKMKRLGSAEKAYVAALAKDPRSIEAMFKLGMVYGRQNQYGKAATQFEQVLRLDPHNKAAKANLQHARKRAAKNRKEKGDPTGGLPPEITSQELYRNAVKLITQRKYRDAIVKLDECLRLKHDFALAYVARGSSYVGIADYRRAIAEYKKALTFNNKLSSPHYGMAEAYRGLGDKAHAKQSYQAYIDSKGRDRDPNMARAAGAWIKKL